MAGRQQFRPLHRNCPPRPRARPLDVPEDPAVVRAAGGPLAAWSAWRAWRERDARFALPLLASGVMLAVLSSACNSRYLYALPMFVPLALAAGPAVADLPRLLSRGLTWLAPALRAGAALALWICWAVLLLHLPVALADTLFAMRPQFTPALPLPLPPPAARPPAGAAP